ncbi:hypothetical protein [Veillonella magna]|uniref:hypothetical protein n=1 Tax=Veillonella magna TaxID=464322 RepID=UPI0023F051B0|nr:hypothetical protein [Veillonella magna]MBD8975205.1 hypothetical protein [Veillonella magna]
MTEDIILLKQPALLWSVETMSPDEAYRRDIDEVRIRLQQMAQQIALQHTSLTTKAETVHGNEYIKERLLTIGYSVEAITSYCELLCSSLQTYKEASSMLSLLRDSQPTYAEHQLNSLLEQNREFNSLLTDLNYYVVLVVNALVNENRSLENLVHGSMDGTADHEQVNNEYKDFIRRGLELNKSLDKRIMYIDGLLRDIRKQMAASQVSRLEAQVAERRRKINEQRYQAKVEDVRDYEDLEGQYRHKYDEEGNLIGTEEGGSGGNRQGIKAIIIAVALVAIVLVAHYFITL